MTEQVLNNRQLANLSDKNEWPDFLSKINRNSKSVTFKQTSFPDGRKEQTVIFKHKTVWEQINQVLVSFCLVMIVIFFSYFFYSLYLDIKANEQILYNNAKVIIEKCKEDYYLNLCDPDNRVPSTEEFCLEKEQCMQQNPNVLGRQQNSGIMVISRSIEAFFKDLSFRTLWVLFLCSLMFTYIFTRIYSN